MLPSGVRLMPLRRSQKDRVLRVDPTYLQKPGAGRRLVTKLIFGSCIVAILYAAFATVGPESEKIDNPGHLAAVHAMFENDCNKCHDGADAQGKLMHKFSKAVSDKACLACHDGAIHHPNQKSFAATNAVTQELQSANCTHCHIEHRGELALAGRSDGYCIECHRNIGQGLGATTQPIDPSVPTQVTVFTEKEHPAFGRGVLKGDKVLDTELTLFTHVKHYEKHGLTDGCTWCHDRDASNGLAKQAGASKGDSELSATQRVISMDSPLNGRDDRRYMFQGNYEKNCKSCHKLGDFPDSDLSIPHGPMSEVRSVILTYLTDSSGLWKKWAGAKPIDKSLPEDLIQYLKDSNIPDDVQTQLIHDLEGYLSTEGNLAGNLNETRFMELRDQLRKVLSQPESTLSKELAGYNLFPSPNGHPAAQPTARSLENVQHLRSGLSGFMVKSIKLPERRKILGEFDRYFFGPGAETPDPRFLEAYVAYDNGFNSCKTCHLMQGDINHVPPEWQTLSNFAPLPPEQKNAATMPTLSIAAEEFQAAPPGLQKWFKNSRFDHDAHRNMNCLECHAGAYPSQVPLLNERSLVPNNTWTGYSHDLTRITIRSCFECHHAPDATGAGARANCTECHDFHDRTKELKPPPDAHPDFFAGK